MADLDIVHLTIEEASRRFSVHPKTIRRWIKAGKLNAERVETAQGYEWRIKALESELPNAEEEPTQTALARLDRLGTTIESVSSSLGNRLDAVLDNVHTDAQAQIEAVNNVGKLMKEGLGHIAAEAQISREQQAERIQRLEKILLAILKEQRRSFWQRLKFW